jgi:hypothetical protein
MQTGNVVQEDKSKVPMMNKALRRKVIWRYTGIAPRNQNDGNEWSLQGPAALTPEKVREFKYIWKQQN